MRSGIICVGLMLNTVLLVKQVSARNEFDCAGRMLPWLTSCEDFRIYVRYAVQNAAWRKRNTAQVVEVRDDDLTQLDREKCYVMVKLSKTTFHDAHSVCAAGGGYLARTSPREDVSNLTSILHNNKLASNTCMWLGIMRDGLNWATNCGRRDGLQKITSPVHSEYSEAVVGANLSLVLCSKGKHNFIEQRPLIDQSNQSEKETVADSFMCQRGAPCGVSSYVSCKHFAVSIMQVTEERQVPGANSMSWAKGKPCYVLMDDHEKVPTWQEASLQCQTYGGRLAWVWGDYHRKVILEHVSTLMQIELEDLAIGVGLQWDKFDHMQWFCPNNSDKHVPYDKYWFLQENAVPTLGDRNVDYPLGGFIVKENETVKFKHLAPNTHNFTVFYLCEVNEGRKYRTESPLMGKDKTETPSKVTSVDLKGVSLITISGIVFVGLTVLVLAIAIVLATVRNRPSVLQDSGTMIDPSSSLLRVSSPELNAVTTSA